MLSVVTASTVEPVSVAEVKQQARIDHKHEDDLIAAYIAAARQWCETYVQRPLNGSAVTYRLTMDSFCDQRYMRGDVIYLPRPPFLGLSGIVYYDSDGDLQLFIDPITDITSEPGRIQPELDQYWPTDVRAKIGSVLITYTAGYSSVSAVPQGCRTAIKMLAAHWYENREPVAAGAGTEVPFGLTALLDPHKWGGYL